MYYIRALISVLVSIYFNTNSAAADYVLACIDERIERVMNALGEFSKMRLYNTHNKVSHSDIARLRAVFIQLKARAKVIATLGDAIGFYFTVVRAQWTHHNLIDAIESSINAHHLCADFFNVSPYPQTR